MGLDMYLETRQTTQIGYWRKANAIHKWFIDNAAEGNSDAREFVVTKKELEQLLDICKQVIKASKLVKGKVRNGYHFGKDGEKVFNLEDGKIIENPAIAKKLLPTTDGFFFGSTDYDHYYLYDIKATIPILVKAIKLAGSEDIYYSASW